MNPSKIKIESFANRCHMGTLGGKGLKKVIWRKRLQVSVFQRKAIM